MSRREETHLHHQRRRMPSLRSVVSLFKKKKKAEKKSFPKKIEIFLDLSFYITLEKHFGHDTEWKTVRGASGLIARFLLSPNENT